MVEYVNRGKEILKILINNGFEAYFVGEVVRNTIMKESLQEVEINTSATPDAIKGIFDFTKVLLQEEGQVTVTYYGYDFIISTFRLEEYKDKRTPVKLHYSKNLNDDLKRRDYTIDSIAMSHSEKLMDGFNGYDDIRKRRLRMIGSPKIRFQEDPVRILKGLRLVSELNFRIAGDVFSAMRRKAKGLRDADQAKIAKELRRLFAGKYQKRAIDLLLRLKVHRHLPHLIKGFRVLDRKYRKLSFDEFLMLSFVSMGKINEPSLSVAENGELVERVVQLANMVPKANYSRMQLFAYQLETCLLANKINWLLKKSRKKQKSIAAAYDQLPVASMSKVDITREDMEQMLPVSEYDKVDVLIDEVVFALLEGHLINNKEDIKNFIVIKCKDREIPLLTREEMTYPTAQKVQVVKPVVLEEDLKSMGMNEAFGSLVNATNEEEIALSLRQQGQVIKDYTEHRLDMLERRINEQDRIIREKDLRFEELSRKTLRRQIQEDVDALIEKNFEFLKELNYLNNPEKNKVELEKQLHKVYKDYITDLMDQYPRGEVKYEKD